MWSSFFPKWKNKEMVSSISKQNWLDRYTKAVIVEFTLFTPSTDSYLAATIILEYLPSGGCLHRVHLDSFQPYELLNTYNLFCEIMYFLLILILFALQSKVLYRVGKGYFLNFWNIINTSVIVLSLGSISLYFYRYYLIHNLLKRIPDKQPNVFINFQYAAYIDQLHASMKGLSAFFIIIKFVQLMKFNRKMRIYFDALNAAWYPLAMFSLSFGKYIQF